MVVFFIIIFFLTTLHAQTMDTILVVDSGSCLREFRPSLELPSGSYIEECILVSECIMGVIMGTMTLTWGPLAAIGEDYETAHIIARKKARLIGAEWLVYVSSTYYNKTGNIATITYRLYSEPCIESNGKLAKPSL